MKCLVLFCAVMSNIGCSDSDRYDNITPGFTPVEYACESVACGPKTELRPCADGGVSFKDECVFVPNKGCMWVSKLCVPYEVDGKYGE